MLEGDGVCSSLVCPTRDDGDTGGEWEALEEDLSTETAKVWQERTGIPMTAEMEADSDRRYTREDYLARTS
jgi:hypothetical protein